MTERSRAEVAGMSDVTLLEKTGKDWAGWVQALDEIGASGLRHAEIAATVQARWPQVDAWWAQTVTVGYERLAGRRAVGQLSSGDFSASKSKTFSVSLKELYAAFADDPARASWLGPATVRSATPERSIRLDWPDGTSVSCWFTDKGAGKSAVSVQHEKLPSADRRDEEKARWSERLAALALRLLSN